MSERGEYRGIRTVLIDGPDYQALSPAARLVFLTLKLALGPTGIDVLYAAQLVEQTGYPHGMVDTSLNELEDGDWIRRERNLIWVVDGLEHEPAYSLSNANHRASIRSHLLALPRLDLIRTFAERYGIDMPSPIPSASHTRSRREGEKERGKKEDKNNIPVPPSGNGDHAPELTLAPAETPDPERTDPPPPPMGQPAPAKPTRAKRTRASGLTPTADEARVLEHYRAVHPSRRALGDEPIRLVRQALGWGYPADDLIAAIDGNAGDSWHREKRKHDLDYVLGRSVKIDEFRDRHADQQTLITDGNGRRLTTLEALR